MSPQTDFAPLLQGIDAVVHLAGRAHVLRDEAATALQQFRRVNVELTLRLAGEALHSGVRRFVFVSSIGVMGNRTAGRPFFRDDPPAPCEDYARSKFEAERGLMSLFRDRGELVMIRPPLVYGPGARGNFQRLMKLVDRLPVLPFAAAGKRSFVHVLNLCSFIERCLQPETPPGTYLVCDEKPLPLRTLLRLMAEAMHKRRAFLRVPAFVLKMLAACAGKRRDVDRLLAELVINNGTDKTITGWQPLYGPDEGIGAMVRHYLREAA